MRLSRDHNDDRLLLLFEPLESFMFVCVPIWSASLVGHWQRGEVLVDDAESVAGWRQQWGAQVWGWQCQWGGAGDWSWSVDRCRQWGWCGQDRCWRSDWHWKWGGGHGNWC